MANPVNPANPNFVDNVTNQTINNLYKMATGWFAAGIYYGLFLAKAGCFDSSGSGQLDLSLYVLNPILSPKSYLNENTIQKMCEAFKAFQNCTPPAECPAISNLPFFPEFAPVWAGGEC